MSTSPYASGSSISRVPPTIPTALRLVGRRPRTGSRLVGDGVGGWGPFPSCQYGLSSSFPRVGVAVRRMLCGIFAVGVLVGSCAGDPPEVPLGPDGQPDPVLAEGRAVYAKHCASCHGQSGGGGQGPRLNNGAVLEAYRNIDDQVAVVSDGKGTMPSFSGRLTHAQIESVTRYTREVLS